MKNLKSDIKSCSLAIAIIIVSVVGLCGILRGVLPSRRELLAECQIEKNGATIRLYNRIGSSATTSDSSIITYQKTDLKEVTIFSAYSSPGIRDLLCESDQIALIEYAEDKPTIFLPLGWIENELIYEPVRFYKSELTSLEYKEEVSDWNGIVVP